MYTHAALWHRSAAWFRLAMLGLTGEARSPALCRGAPGLYCEVPALSREALGLSRETLGWPGHG